MMKRTVLGVLALVVGLLTATSIEGLAIGLPLVAAGLYAAAPARVRYRVRRPSPLSAR